MSKLAKVLCVALSVLMIFSTSMSASAKSTTALKSEKEKIQDRIEATQKKINSLKQKKEQQQEYVDALTEKIDLIQDKLDNLEGQRNALQSEIDSLQKRIEDTQKQIDDIQREIDEKQAQFKDVYDLYCQRLRAMYISGNVSTLEMFLDSGWDMSALLTRAQMVKSVAEKDNETLEELMVMMQEITEQRQTLADKSVQLKNDKEQLDSQRVELQSSIDEINKSKSELDAEVAECNAAIRKLNSETAEYQEEIDTDQDRLDEIENEIRNAGNGSNIPTGSYTPGTGRLGYPTSSRRVNAGYPNYSSGRYHGGIDFGCPVGTTVYAADSGYVSLVKYLTYSYGRYVVIYHGNGLSTLYAHNSEILVSQGQAVKKGQPIARSGQTGNATGPHCHFEVRLNGTRVNPWNYLG